MDILIKNIGGLPEDGDLTLTITPKGQVILGGCIFTSNFGKEVKAVALPPHGELIEREKLIEDSLKAEAFLPNNEIVEWFQKKISSAPTILEASATTSSRNHTCPYYQGVCGLDDAFLCYCQSRYEMCDTYKEATE